MSVGVPLTGWLRVSVMSVGVTVDRLASGVVFNRHTVPKPGEYVTCVKRSHSF